MTFEDVKKIVAKKTGLNLAQNKSLIETAINGALEEIGVHLTIAKAILSRNIAISADSNYVRWTIEYARFVSVIYQYNSGASTYQRPLTKASPTEFDIINAGLQSQSTDMLTRYCPRGDKIYVGPGNADTGGYIVVTYQRKLAPDDIADLPDSNMVVWGAVANLLDVDHPSQEGFRNMFVRALVPAAIASEPTKEQHDTVKLDNQILRDMDHIESLGG